MSWNEQPEMWLAGIFLILGLIIGIAADVAARWYMEMRRRTKLGFHSQLEDAVSYVGSHVEISWPLYSVGYQKGTPPLKLWATVWRLRIDNDGASAALDVRGTQEYENRERRICWYEGNVPVISINAHDHSYLNLYAVPEDNERSVVPPTEHGWPGYRQEVQVKETWHLRVTASNCQPVTLRLEINPEERCKPENVEVVPAAPSRIKAAGDADPLKLEAKSQAKAFLGVAIGFASSCVIAYQVSTTGFVASAIFGLMSVVPSVLLATFYRFDNRWLRKSAEILVIPNLDYVWLFLGIYVVGIALIQKEVVLLGAVVIIIAYVVLFLPGYWRLARRLSRVVCWLLRGLASGVSWLAGTAKGTLRMVSGISRMLLSEFIRQYKKPPKGKDSGNE